MQAQDLSAIAEPPPLFTRRPPTLTAHRGRKLVTADSEDTVNMDRSLAAISPMHSLEGFAATMFVASVAAGWIAVATTATMPLLAAGELMARASRAMQRA